MKRKRRKGDAGQIAARLAPLEEQDKPAAEQQIGAAYCSVSDHTDPHFGAIVVDNDNLNVPTDITEQGEKHFLGMEPVVLVVLVLMLAFIAFITWQISLMPAQ